MNEYWREQLDRESEKCYSLLLKGIREQTREIECGRVSAESVKNAYFALYNDHPEFFYLSSTPHIVQRTSGFAGFGALRCTSSFVMNPIYSPGEIRAFRQKIEDAKESVRRKLSLGATDEEKIVRAAEYLVRGTVYEIDNRFHQNAAAALCNGRAQCSGIAKAFKLLMDALGVYCIVVSGEAADEKGNFSPHAWNIVKLGDRCYHVDVTFMLGANPDKAGQMIHMYLFYDDAMCARNHVWDKNRLPVCDDRSKLMDDLNEKGVFIRKKLPYEDKTQEESRWKHYGSLSQLKKDLTEIIRKRETSIQFYLDVDLATANEVCGAVKNAFCMVIEKEAVSCSFTVSVGQGLLVKINISY